MFFIYVGVCFGLCMILFMWSVCVLLLCSEVMSLVLVFECRMLSVFCLSVILFWFGV